MTHRVRIGQAARKRNWRWVSVGLPVAVAVTALVLAMCLWSPGLPASDGRGDTQWPGWGFTHTQFSADVGLQRRGPSRTRAGLWATLR